ncbi:hypothetical protein Tco_0867415 [Tanacetum coccineum]
MVDANQALEERLDKHGSRLYRLENQDIPNQVSKVVDEIVMDAVDWAMHAPLRERFRDLPEADMKEILHNRMWESEYVIAERDFKYLYPNDFEDLNLVIRQRVEDFQLGIESYQTQLNPQNLAGMQGIRDMHDFHSDCLSQESRNSGSTGGIWVWIHDFGRRKTSTEARSLCLPYRNDLRQDDVRLFLDPDDPQSRRDLPRGQGQSTSSVEALGILRYDIKRSKSENKGIVLTEMELVLEQTQQGTSHEVSDYIKMEMQKPLSSKVKFIATCSYSRLNDFITSRKNDPKLPQTLISTSSSSVCQSDEVMN